MPPGPWGCPKTAALLFWRLWTNHSTGVTHVSCFLFGKWRLRAGTVMLPLPPPAAINFSGPDATAQKSADQSCMWRDALPVHSMSEPFPRQLLQRRELDCRAERKTARRPLCCGCHARSKLESFYPLSSTCITAATCTTGISLPSFLCRCDGDDTRVKHHKLSALVCGVSSSEASTTRMRDARGTSEYAQRRGECYCE